MKKTKIALILALSIGLGMSYSPVISFAQIASWAKPSYDYLNSKKILPVKLRDTDFSQNITRQEFTQLITTFLLANKSYNLDDYSKSIYKDVNDKFINLASSIGITSGYTDGTFKPDLSITRAEAASIAFRAEKILSPNISGTTPSAFKDYKFIQEWAADAVGYMSTNNIMSGFPDGSFKPSNNITRQEAIVLTKNLANKKSSTALTNIYDFVKDDEYMKKTEYEFIFSNLPSGIKFKQEQIKQAVFDTFKEERDTIYKSFTDDATANHFNAKTSPNLAFAYDRSYYVFGIEQRTNINGKTEQRVFMSTLAKQGETFTIEKEKAYSSWFVMQ